jgi:hypothetical protein
MDVYSSVLDKNGNCKPIFTHWQSETAKINITRLVGLLCAELLD